jgi:hypothetical protein
MFVVGERITVQGAPHRVDPHACYVNTLVLAGTEHHTEPVRPFNRRIG